MDRKNRQPKKASSVALNIEAEVVVNGQKQKLVEPVPEGVPRKLLPHLADYMARGFSAGIKAARQPEVVSLAEFVESGRGRPIDEQNEREGREAAQLRKTTKLAFGMIARRVCRNRSKPGHQCNKKCVDRIKQALKKYDERDYIISLTRPE